MVGACSPKPFPCALHCQSANKTKLVITIWATHLFFGYFETLFLVFQELLCILIHEENC